MVHRKPKTTFTIPRKIEMHVCIPRPGRAPETQDEDEDELSTVSSSCTISDRSAIVTADPVDTADTADTADTTDDGICMQPSFIGGKSETSYLPDSEETQSNYKCDGDTFTVTSGMTTLSGETVTVDCLERMDYFPTIKYSDLYFYKHNTEEYTLIPEQQQMIRSARARDMMINITVKNFDTLWGPTQFSASLSIAKHLEINENRRLDPSEILLIAIRNYWFNNLIIKIGNYSMLVDQYIFKYYVKMFRNNASCFLELPGHQVSMNTMMGLYNWMITDDDDMNVGKNFLDMFELAKYLQVQPLLDQFWTTFSINENRGFSEQDAFRGYLLAKERKCADMVAILLGRVSKVFMPLVASIEYLQMSAEEVIYLLTREMICVNSEDEIFFSIIRWLEYDYEKRQEDMMDVLATVRYNFLTPWLIRSILFKPENDIIADIGQNNYVKAMLWNACLYGQAHVAYKANKSGVEEKFVMELLGEQIEQRLWVHCPGVSHHHDLLCPRYRMLTYDTFKLYLNAMQLQSDEYLETVKYISNKLTNTYRCCSDINFTDVAFREQVPIIRPPCYGLD